MPMKRRSRFPYSPAKAALVVMVLAGLGLLSLVISRASPDPAEPAEAQLSAQAALAAEQVLVRYRIGADVQALETLGDRFAQLGAQQVGELKDLRIKLLKVPPAARLQVIERLRADPLVEFAEADSVVRGEVTRPNDPEYASQWSLPKTLIDIAWDRSRGSQSILVANVDTGINFGHPEFAGKTVPGFDFVNNDSNPTDDNGHGSATAGVIGALTNNGAGMAGGCWECKILPVKVLDGQNAGTISNLAKGIEYAANNGAKIINASVSAAGTSSALETAVNYAAGKGILVVAAASNTGKQEVRIPASYPNVIAVAATDQNDVLTTYSTFGAHVDIAAPGRARTAAGTGSGYVSIDGTSFSTPTVSAILALLWSAFPNATPAQLRDAVTKTSEVCCDAKISGGRINAAKAMAYMAGNGTLADVVRPTAGITAPAAGATVSGSVPVNLTAADNVAVAKVDLQINGGIAGADTTAPYNFTWDTTKAPEGPATLKITSFDTTGNSTVVTRTVTVTRATTPPPTPPAPTPTPTPPAPTPPPPSPNPNPAPKPADLNNDGKVNIADLSILLSNWGKAGVPADLNNSGKVDIADLSILLTNWTK